MQKVPQKVKKIFDIEDDACYNNLNLFLKTLTEHCLVLRVSESRWLV